MIWKPDVKNCNTIDYEGIAKSITKVQALILLIQWIITGSCLPSDFLFCEKKISPICVSNCHSSFLLFAIENILKLCVKKYIPLHPSWFPSALFQKEVSYHLSKVNVIALVLESFPVFSLENTEVFLSHVSSTSPFLLDPILSISTSASLLCLKNTLP